MSKNNRKLTTPQSLNFYIKGICDIMRRSGRAGALQYVPELTWMLFLRILDEKEHYELEQAKAVSVEFRPSLEYPYRWQDWASPEGKKRKELQESTLGVFMSFVNGELIPYLRDLKNKPGVISRQKVISEVFSSIEKTGIDTERNLLDILDKINELSIEQVDQTHMFTLSQIYEGLLLKMGEKNNDGGQFFTPREVIRVMVKVIDPKIGETVYDPGCGTGGFLAQAYQYMRPQGDTGINIETLKTRTFYGKEKENLIYPIALANLVLHEIDEPHIWHGNTLTRQEFYGGLFAGAPGLFDVVLTNPPFGGEEEKRLLANLPFKTSDTELAGLYYCMRKLKAGGRCGIVQPEGALFRTSGAYLQVKKELLENNNLHTIISLPSGVFANVSPKGGTGPKTNLLFFEKGIPTKEIWYYELTPPNDKNYTRTNPIKDEDLEDAYKKWEKKETSGSSWVVKVEDIVNRDYDLSAKNPNKVTATTYRTPKELLKNVLKKEKEIEEILRQLKF